MRVYNKMTIEISKGDEYIQKEKRKRERKKKL